MMGIKYIVKTLSSQPYVESLFHDATKPLSVPSLGCPMKYCLYRSVKTKGLRNQDEAIRQDMKLHLEKIHKIQLILHRDHSSINQSSTERNSLSFESCREEPMGNERQSAQHLDTCSIAPKTGSFTSPMSLKKSCFWTNKQNNNTNSVRSAVPHRGIEITRTPNLCNSNASKDPVTPEQQYDPEVVTINSASELTPLSQLEFFTPAIEAVPSNQLVTTPVLKARLSVPSPGSSPASFSSDSSPCIDRNYETSVNNTLNTDSFILSSAASPSMINEAIAYIPNQSQSTPKQEEYEKPLYCIEEPLACFEPVNIVEPLTFEVCQSLPTTSPPTKVDPNVFLKTFYKSTISGREYDLPPCKRKRQDELIERREKRQKVRHPESEVRPNFRQEPALERVQDLSRRWWKEISIKSEQSTEDYCKQLLQWSLSQSRYKAESKIDPVWGFR